jgi:uncharacterized repeat protein (TIGR01451 family)
MKNKPQRPIAGIVIGIVGIIVITAIALVIAYTINKMRDVTPTETEAGTCCNCVWTLKLSGGTEISLGSTGGIVSAGKCLVTPRFRTIEDSVSFIGEYKPISCTDIPIGDVFEVPPYGLSMDDSIIAKETQAPCEGGCILNTSDPLIAPRTVNETNENVTFTAVFELRYVTDENKRFTEAEMVFEYPGGKTPPDPVSAESLEQLSTYHENDNEKLEIALFEATFPTTWDTVMNYSDTTGIYKVKFRAKDQSGSWTDTIPGTRQFVVPSGSDTGEYCIDLDYAPVSGPSDGSDRMDVTFNVYAETPDPNDVSYIWQLDLNCSGEIDAGTGQNAEEFSTGPGTTSVTRTFTYPSGATGSVECPVSVDVKVDEGTRTISELTDGSCSGYVRLSQVSEDCGNGVCDTGEYCDINGNIRCPAGTPLPIGTTCSELCTYCGDGVVNGTEECDPAINEGETGYEPLCQDTCVIGTTPVSGGDGDDTDSDTGSGDSTSSSGTITITQDTPECVEMVAPNNIASITISVTNNSSADYSIRAVSDTLPQGITYQTGSSLINAAPDTTDSGVTVEQSGDSQLVTWDNQGSGWTLGAGDSLSIAFTAVVGPDATIGTQTNRVTVTPSDENPIPSQSPILIGQTCTQPLTGLFDRNARLILMGSVLLLIAGAGFYIGVGNRVVAFFLDKTGTALSHISQPVSDVYLKLTRPQKYMEKRIERSARKKVESHSGKKSTSSK